MEQCSIGPDGRQVTEERRYLCESLTVKGIAPWLISYWMGRRLGLLDSAGL